MNRIHVVLSLFSNLEMGKIQHFFGQPLKHVITIRGQILVSRTGDDPLRPVSAYVKTSPCVRAPRVHVEIHVRVVLLHTVTF